MNMDRRGFLKIASLATAAAAFFPKKCVETLAAEPEEQATKQHVDTSPAPPSTDPDGEVAVAFAVGALGKNGEKEPNNEQKRMLYAERIMEEYNIPSVVGATNLKTDDDIQKSRIENSLKITDQLSREGWYQFGAGIAGGLAADALLNKVKFDFSGRELVNIAASTTIITVAERETKVSSIIAPITKPETLMDEYGLAEDDAVRFCKDQKAYSSIKTGAGALTGATAFEAKDAVHKGFETVQRILKALQNKSEPTEPGVY